VTTSTKQALIAAAMPLLKFENITKLLYIRDGQEVEELSTQLGLAISSRSLPKTFVAGNQVANATEFWLHPDGTLHRYIWTACWSDPGSGCSQRHYVGLADEQEISLKELQDQIEMYLSEEDDEEMDEPGTVGDS
jgi:hypothetical protein